jgi:hypothetical protein
MKNRARGSAGFLSFEKVVSLSPPCEGGVRGGGDARPGNRTSFFRRNNAVIFQLLLGWIADCLHSGANEGDITARAGLCVSTPPLPLVC